jgi:hypothetical protein
VLECVVQIQPSPASQIYTLHLRYRHGARPRVTVAHPELVIRPGDTSLPHVYEGEELCLYYPGEWRHDMFLSATVLPWAAEWLLHYEIRLFTGKWHGAGHE